MFPLLAVAALPIIGQALSSIFTPAPDMTEINKLNEETSKAMEQTNKSLVDFGSAMKDLSAVSLSMSDPMGESFRQPMQHVPTPSLWKV